MANGFGFNPMFAGSMACPACAYGPGMMGGYAGMGMGGPGMGFPYGAMGGPGMGFPYGFTPPFAPGFGGPMTWGGTFPGMYPGAAPGMYPGAAPGMYTQTLPSDDQIREMIFDTIDADPVVPYESDITVEVTGGVVTLSGTVPSKRIKHAVGDDSWWVPGVWDVNNNLQITGRRERVTPTPTAAAETMPTKTTTAATKETRKR